MTQWTLSEYRAKGAPLSSKQKFSAITLEVDPLLSVWDADKGCPLPLKRFILPQVKESITWQKENFLFSSPPQAGFQTKRVSLMLKYTHYTSKTLRQRIKGGRNIPTHFIKVQLLHSIRRGCCTFPSTFSESKSESTKSLFACIINAFGMKEVAKSKPWIQILINLGNNNPEHLVDRYESLNIWIFNVYFLLVRFYIRFELMITDFNESNTLTTLFVRWEWGYQSRFKQLSTLY